MSNKAKGSRAERELLELFTQNGWSAARVAGSGVNENTFCDLIVGKKGKRAYTIEAKSSKSPRIYITKQQIEEFVRFSEVMGLTPVVAARFNREGWLFINPLDPDQLEDSGANWVVNLKNAKINGKKFGQFFETQSDEFI
jgi:Holliday junction resolvase